MIYNALILTLIAGCNTTSQAQIATTTAPVYQFTAKLCAGTDLSITRLVTENVSCLHDYTLQTSQMRAIENAEVVIISGAGLESFLDEALINAHTIIDASAGISLICHDEDHEHHNDTHSHSVDPHIWLSPANAEYMARNICAGLSALYPKHKDVFEHNLSLLLNDLRTLQEYAAAQLADLSCREIVTFHDGFSYMSQAFELEILHSIEEESAKHLQLNSSTLLILLQIITCPVSLQKATTIALQSRSLAVKLKNHSIHWIWQCLNAIISQQCTTISTH